MQGWRRSMEDAHIANTSLGGGCSLFGVFDGHGLLGHVVSNKIKIFFGDYFARPEVFGYKDNSIKVLEEKLAEHGLNV